MLRLLCILAALVSATTATTTYYVSNEFGDDNNAGTVISSPWKTLSKVSSAQGSLRSGDQVLFCNGDSWFQDGLSLTATGLTYSVYDCGMGSSHPAFTRSAHIAQKTWSQNSNGYLQADLTGYPNAISNGVSGVWVDSFRFVHARIPNLVDPQNRLGQRGDFWWMDNGNDGGHAVLTSQAINQPNTSYYTGSTLHYRAYDWLYYTTPITASSGTTVTCGWDIGRPIGGLFFEAGTDAQGSAWLDAPGEFFYDSSAKTLTIVPLNAQMAAGILSGEQSVYANFFSNNPTISINTNNIKIFNISVIMSSGSGINLGNKGTITLNRVYVSQIINGQGITGNGNAVMIQNSVVADTDESCISGSFSGTSQITYSTLTSCGVYQGYPSQNLNGFSGVVPIFSWNYVANTGYAGINPNTGTSIFNNQFFNSCLVLNDCGTIYSYYQSNIPIYNNTIDGLVANGAGYGTNSLGAGIYMDQGTTNFVAQFNTVKNVIQCAYLHMGTGHTFSYNRCESPGIFVVGGGTNGGGYKVTNNVVYTHGTNSVLQNPMIRILNQWSTTLSDVFANFSNNVYCFYSDAGNNNYVYQIQTSQGTWRSNDFSDYESQGVSIMPTFEQGSQWRQHLPC